MVLNVKERRKIGLLGGTFDPVHKGHLAVARHVLHALDLDAVWFIPAALPPHKPGHAGGGDISGFTHRFAMLQRAVEADSPFVVSDIEAKRSMPSYSIDTLSILRRQVGEDVHLFFIIGADAFFEIDTWKRYKELPDLVNFVVISRPGYPPDKVGEVIRHNFTDYTCNHGLETWSSRQSRGSFILLHMEPVPISSTGIRDMVKNGENITGLVPQGVADYIREQQLYRS